jgi:hypothetical protein
MSGVDSTDVAGSERATDDQKRLLCVCVYLRGRVSNLATNGSTRAVMDVIRFLHVSLGNSTVQPDGSLGSRHACACSEAGFNSQNGDSA